MSERGFRLRALRFQLQFGHTVKVIGRHDQVLLIGFIVAAVVVFARPVRYLLDVAGEVERSSGLALTPALIILTVFFLFHLQTKRQEAKAHALRAEAETIEADARATEMERLVTFGQALARSLDLEAIRDVVAQQLPRLAGTDAVWVLVQVDGHWHALFGVAGEGRVETERIYQRIADRALEQDSHDAVPQPVVVDGQLCVPLKAGGEAVGVMGMPEPATAFGEGRRRALTAGLTLLGISVRNARLFREVKENGLRDGLTGCYNRTHAVEVITTELRRARRSQAPTSLILFDIDHFKQINDRYGHLGGDAVLAMIGGRMRTALRSSDFKCRYGGEEFLVLLPDTPLAGAKHVAENLRREVADNMHVTWKGERIQVTASFGVTAALPSEIDLQAFIGRADAALYRAKDQGRNCVRLAIEAAVT
jgi:diguanylate cyclase (GGDEF)-like protein